MLYKFYYGTVKKKKVNMTRSTQLIHLIWKVYAFMTDIDLKEKKNVIVFQTKF